MVELDAVAIANAITDVMQGIVAEMRAAMYLQFYFSDGEFVHIDIRRYGAGHIHAAKPFEEVELLDEMALIYEPARYTTVMVGNVPMIYTRYFVPFLDEEDAAPDYSLTLPHEGMMFGFGDSDVVPPSIRNKKVFAFDTDGLIFVLTRDAACKAFALDVLRHLEDVVPRIYSEETRRDMELTATELSGIPIGFHGNAEVRMQMWRRVAWFLRDGWVFEPRFPTIVDDRRPPATQQPPMKMRRVSIWD